MILIYAGIRRIQFLCQFVMSRNKSLSLNVSLQWLPLLTTKEDVDRTLKDAKAAGIKVMRTWVSVSDPLYRMGSKSERRDSTQSMPLRYQPLSPPT